MPVSRRYPGPRESVHIKLLVYPVGFSHNNVVLTQSLLTMRLAVSEIKPVQSQTYRVRRTDGRTDRQTDRIVNYSNSRCACARGLNTSIITRRMLSIVG